MKGTRPLDNNEIRNLGLVGGLNFRWQYKILPYNVWNEANFYYQINSDKYENIASELGADPLIASLLDNLGTLFASGKIAVEPKITKAIKDYADVVPAAEAGLEGFRIPVYRIKPEFQKYFPSDDYDQFDE